MVDHQAAATMLLLQQYAAHQQRQPGTPSSSSGATTADSLSPFFGSGAQPQHQGGFKPGSKGGGDRGRGIVESHRKTEMCRNLPNCKYGSRCAFAHSKEELRRLSLSEMEQAGRIPNANKYRCFPCLSFFSTGACPYNDRCVFIHDPRIKGPARAWLYATPGSSAARHSAGKGPLYWPDLPQPAEETDALFTASIEYEVVPRNSSAPTYFEASVWAIWQSFRATMQHIGGLGQDSDLGLGRALYGPGCDAPVRRLPVFERLSEVHARSVREAGPGYDEEAAAMASFAYAHPPAHPGVPYVIDAAGGAASSVGAAGGALYVMGPAGTLAPAHGTGPSGAATPTTTTTANPSPFSSPRSLVMAAGVPTPKSAAAAAAATPAAIGTPAASTTMTVAITPASPNEIMAPWGSEWREQQEQRQQLAHPPTPAPAAAAALVGGSVAATAGTTKTLASIVKSRLLQPPQAPQPERDTDPVFALVKLPTLPTGSGSVWPLSTPTSRPASTAPPSPLLTPQGAAALAGAEAAAAAGGASSPSLSSVGSVRSKGTDSSVGSSSSSSSSRQ